MGLTARGGRLSSLTVVTEHGSLRASPARPWCWLPATPPGTPSKCSCALRPAHGGQALRHRRAHRAPPGEHQPGPVRRLLGQAARPRDYKLACHLPNGRSAFTFCVCPGGQVVAAASAARARWSPTACPCRARDGGNINGGFLVGVGPADFGGNDPLAGVRFQEKWERAAWDIGTGGLPPRTSPAPPASSPPPSGWGTFWPAGPPPAPAPCLPTYRPGVTWRQSGRLRCPAM